jgi:hypothetical protein
MVKAAADAAALFINARRDRESARDMDLSSVPVSYPVRPGLINRTQAPGRL